MHKQQFGNGKNRDKEIISFSVLLYLVIFTFSNAFMVPLPFWKRNVPIRCVSSSLSERDEGGRESNGFPNCILR